MPASEPAPWEAIAGMNTSEAISGAAARTAQTGRQHRHAGLRAGTLRGVGGDGTGTMPTAAKGLRATLVLPFFQQQKKGRKECRRGIRLHPGMLARRTLKFINLPTASNSMNFGRARRWDALSNGLQRPGGVSHKQRMVETLRAASPTMPTAQTGRQHRRNAIPRIRPPRIPGQARDDRKVEVRNGNVKERNPSRHPGRRMRGWQWRNAIPRTKPHGRDAACSGSR